MILGMSLATFTTLHVIISLVGIAAGLIVLAAMLASKEPRGLTALFLCTTILTSATGFMFHSAKIGPPHVVGVISLVVLALALVGLYVKHLNGPWRTVYVISAVLSLYLNAFVGVVQAFQKIAFLKPLAPTGSARETRRSYAKISALSAGRSPLTRLSVWTRPARFRWPIPIGTSAPSACATRRRSNGGLGGAGARPRAPIASACAPPRRHSRSGRRSCRSPGGRGPPR